MAKKTSKNKSDLLLDKYEKLLEENFKQKEIIRTLSFDLEFYEMERAAFLIEVNKTINKDIQFIGNLEDFAIDYNKIKSNRLVNKIVYGKDNKTKKIFIKIMTAVFSMQERVYRKLGR